jgi:quinoprotein dehydrogenase-associated probable ABC transporter substrate-binding protein
MTVAPVQTRARCLSALALLILAGTAVAAPAPEAEPPALFKVCAPPYNLPMSEKDGSGYENRIAELFASQLGEQSTYTWFPQRMGFVRATLKNNDTEDGEYKCDVVMGVIENFELAATTQPYLHSTWAMVYATGQGLDWIKTQDDLKKLSDTHKAALKIGIWDQGPTTEWVSRLGLIEQAEAYPIMSGDPKQNPAYIVETELMKGNINLTFLWGPMAGYVQQKLKNAGLVVIPLHNEPGLKFDYQIAMAVRHGDEARRQQLDKLIDKNQQKIDQILAEYGVPLLPLEKKKRGGDDD